MEVPLLDLITLLLAISLYDVSDILTISAFFNTKITVVEDLAQTRFPVGVLALRMDEFPCISGVRIRHFYLQSNALTQA